MNTARFIKKSLCAVLSISILLAFSACTGTDNVFTRTEDGILISASGTEYAHLANEGILYYLGDLVFQGRVKGEAKTSQHLGFLYQTGLFSIKNAETDNILVRRTPNNEWFSIYRKTSLPPFDFSADNCTRLELVLGIGNIKNDGIHTTCGDGISNRSVITEFLSDVRSQTDPREAGLYDLIKKTDGMLENCYIYAVIYGFFEDEPNLAIRMDITSYNDLAYSVCIEGKEYVLPETWIQRFQNN